MVIKCTKLSPLALIREKNPRHPLDRGSDCRGKKQQNPFPLPVIEILYLQSPVRSPVSIPTELFRHLLKVPCASLIKQHVRKNAKDRRSIAPLYLNLCEYMPREWSSACPGRFTSRCKVQALLDMMFGEPKDLKWTKPRRTHLRHR
jgi:hypothetical protein